MRYQVLSQPSIAFLGGIYSPLTFTLNFVSPHLFVRAEVTVATGRPFLFLLSPSFWHLPPSGEMTASRSLQAQYQGMAPLTPQGKMLLSFSPLTASTEKSDDPSCFAALIIGGMRPIVHHPCIPPPPLPAAKSPSSLPVPLSLLSLPYLGKSLCCTLGFFCPFFPSSKKKVDNGRGFLFFLSFFSPFSSPLLKP